MRTFHNKEIKQSQEHIGFVIIGSSLQSSASLRSATSDLSLLCGYPCHENHDDFGD